MDRWNQFIASVISSKLKYIAGFNQYGEINKIINGKVILTDYLRWVAKEM